MPQVSGTPAAHDKRCSDDRWRRGSQGDQEGLHIPARVLPPPSHQEGPFWSPVDLSPAPFSVLSGSRDEEGEVLLFFKFKRTFKITSLVPSAHFINGESEA